MLYREFVLKVYHGSDFMTRLSKSLYCESISANMTLVNSYTRGLLLMTGPKRLQPSIINKVSDLT